MTGVALEGWLTTGTTGEDFVFWRGQQEVVTSVPRRAQQRVQVSRLAGTFASVYLAGLRIPDEDVRELITLVDEPTRSFLEKSLALDSEVVALTIEDRERILWALDDVRTEALTELRGVLLQEHEWRVREGPV